MTAGTRCVVSGPPLRLDRFLQQWLGGAFGRRRIAAMLAAGDVRVNARRARKGLIVHQGDEVTIDPSPVAVASLVPTPLALTVVHVDDDIVAIDKPAGLPSLGGARSPSVASALLATFPEMAAIDPVRSAGLVHRLDTGTSGLILAARHPSGHARLRAAFAGKRATKEYLAVVVGELSERGTIDQPLRRRRGTRGRMEPARAGEGWPAVTAYEPIQHSPAMTLVRLRMRTGVTHQLRAHMAEIGHPIVGDTRYGPTPERAVAVPFDGHCLHALSVEFDGAEFPCLATDFPSHWRPLCDAAGWSMALPAPTR